MYYVKRGLFVLVLLLILGVAFLPWWTTSMAEKGLKNPKDPMSQTAVRKAVQIKMAIFLYPEAGRICEKALEVFGDSKHRPYFLYKAALCAEKQGNHKKAIELFTQFSKDYKAHAWFTQAIGHVKKLKALHEDE